MFSIYLKVENNSSLTTPKSSELNLGEPGTPEIAKPDSKPCISSIRLVE